MRQRRYSNQMLLFSMLLFTSNFVISAGALSPLPHAISGRILSPEGTIPDYLLLDARINGTIYASTYVKDGEFGVNPSFKVPSDDPTTETVEGGRLGDLILLFLDGERVGELVFEPGRINRLILETDKIMEQKPRVLSGGPYYGVAGYTVKLDSAVVFNPEDNEPTYSWDLGDGSTSSQLEPSHKYAHPGDYIVNFKLEDSSGVVDSVKTIVHVATLPDPIYGRIHPVPIIGESESIEDQETGLSFHLNSIGAASLSLLSYMEPFLQKGKPPIINGAYSLGFSNLDEIAWPIYVERRMDETVPGAGFYTWSEGVWKRVSCTGIAPSKEIVWAWLTKQELEEGLLLLGADPGNYVEVVSVETVVLPDNVYEFKVNMLSRGYEGNYTLNIGLDGEILERRSTTFSNGETRSESFEYGLETGTHLLDVNGLKYSVKVDSLIKPFQTILFSIIPMASLVLFVMKKLF